MIPSTDTAGSRGTEAAAVENPLGAAMQTESRLPRSQRQAAPASLTLPHKTLGEKVVALGLIAPTLLNWFVLAHARWYATAELEDSEGVTYTIALYRNFNFEIFFFIASIVCISSVFAHIWLTTGAIARRHALDQAGAYEDMGYGARLAQAQAEAKRLSKAEWAHLALMAFDFAFASFFVFASANDIVGQAILGLAPPIFVVLLAWRVLAPARAAVLRSQRTNSVAFSGSDGAARHRRRRSCFVLP